MWLTKYTGGAAAQGGAIYAQGDSFVYAQGLRLNANAAPAIQTVNNVTMLLNTTCFTDNGDATTVRSRRQACGNEQSPSNEDGVDVCCGS